MSGLRTIAGVADPVAAVRGVAEGLTTGSAAPTTATTTGSEAQDTAFTGTPHTRIRKAIASWLSESKRTIPHF